MSIIGAKVKCDGCGRFGPDPTARQMHAIAMPALVACDAAGWDWNTRADDGSWGTRERPLPTRHYCPKCPIPDSWSWPVYAALAQETTP